MPRVKMERGSDKAPESDVPEVVEVVEQPAAEVQVQKRGRPGFTVCLVRGNVIAEGFVDGERKTEFRDGQVAEFQDSDVKSLPDSLVPIV